MSNRRKHMSDGFGAAAPQHSTGARTMPGAANQIRMPERGPDLSSVPSAASQLSAMGEDTTGGGEGHGGGGGGGGWTGTVHHGPAPSRSGLDLRQVLTGSTLRKIMGIPSVMADIILAQIKAPSGGTLTAVANDRSDVYVGFQDIISNIFGTGRLFAPANVLWRLPKSGESAMVLKPTEGDGTGIPYVLYGDGGKASQVPAFLGSNDCGIAADENVHIESGNKVTIKGGSGALTVSGADGAKVCTISVDGNSGIIRIEGGIGAEVQIDATGGGNVVVNGGTLNVARITDQVAGTAGPYPIVNGVISGPVGAQFFKA